MKDINLDEIKNAGYEICSSGIIRGINGGRALKPFFTSDGYARVTLMVSGRKEKFRVHRLVAKKFIPERPECHEVNHKDGNRMNNAIENLEWVSRDENNFHKAHGDSSTRDSIFKRFISYIEAGKPIYKIAKELGVSKSTIYRWNHAHMQSEAIKSQSQPATGSGPLTA